MWHLREVVATETRKTHQIKDNFWHKLPQKPQPPAYGPLIQTEEGKTLSNKICAAKNVCEPAFRRRSPRSCQTTSAKWTKNAVIQRQTVHFTEIAEGHYVAARPRQQTCGFTGTARAGDEHPQLFSLRVTLQQVAAEVSLSQRSPELGATPALFACASAGQLP